MPISVQSLVFAGKGKTAITGAGGFTIPLDAAEVVSHRFSNQLSDNPREDGSVVTDHVLHQPNELTIEGLVSDYPMAIAGGVLSGTGGAAALGRIGASLGADVTTPRQTAYDLLKRAVTEQLLLDVETSLGTFSNMIAEAVEVGQTHETANALRFRLALREMATATTSESPIDLALVLPDGPDLASPATERGFQPAVAS